MESYSQQGFRPGRRVLIIRDSIDPENVGKSGVLKFSHGHEEFEYEGVIIAGHPTLKDQPAWIVEAEDQTIKWTLESGRVLRMNWASYVQSSLMLIDDPDKELDTMEERLNNAHPLLLTHKQEEKV